MRSQKSVDRKNAKARARRKDYEWRKNVKHSLPRVGSKKTHISKTGRILVRPKVLVAGDGFFPKSRKYTAPKKKVAVKKVAKRVTKKK